MSDLWFWVLEGEMVVSLQGTEGIIQGRLSYICLRRYLRTVFVYQYETV